MSDQDDDIPPRPDLQALVALAGLVATTRIPSEAWAEWDRQNSEWQERRRAYYRTLKSTTVAVAWVEGASRVNNNSTTRDAPARCDFNPDELVDQESEFPPSHPRGHPLTRDEAAHSAQLLGVDPSPALRLELHVGIAGTLFILLHGWRGRPWLNYFLAQLADEPEKTIRAADGDSVEAFVIGMLAERGVGISKLNADQFGRAVANFKVPVKRGNRGDEVRAIFFETLTAIARDVGSDLELPSADNDLAAGDTPLYLFVRGALEMLCERGRSVLAADPAISASQRARALANLAAWERIGRVALIRALDRARTKILREVPIWRANTK